MVFVAGYGFGSYATKRAISKHLAYARAWRASLSLAMMAHDLGGSNASNYPLCNVSLVVRGTVTRAVVVVLATNVDSLVVAVVATPFLVSSTTPLALIVIFSVPVDLTNAALIVVIFFQLALTWSLDKLIRRLRCSLSFTDNNGLLGWSRFLLTLSDDNRLWRWSSSFLDDDRLWRRLREVLGGFGVSLERIWALRVVVMVGVRRDSRVRRRGARSRAMADDYAVLLDPAGGAGRREASVTLHNAILDAVIAIATSVLVPVCDGHTSVLDVVVLWDLVAADGCVRAVAADGLRVPVALALTLLDCDGSHGCAGLR